MSFASSRRLCTSPQLENFLSLPAPALTIRAGGRQSRRTLYGQEMNEAKDTVMNLHDDYMTAIKHEIQSHADEA